MRDIQQYKNQILSIFAYYSTIGLLQEDVYEELLISLQSCTTIEEMTQIIDMDAYMQYFTYVSNRILPRVDTLKQQGISYDLYSVAQTTPYIVSNMADIDMAQDIEPQDDFKEEEEIVSTTNEEDDTTYIDLGDTYTYIDDTASINPEINESFITATNLPKEPANDFLEEDEVYDENDQDDIVTFPLENTFSMAKDDILTDASYEDTPIEEDEEYYDDEEEDYDDDEDAYDTTSENTQTNTFGAITSTQTNAPIQQNASVDTSQKAISIPQVYEDAATQKLLEQVTKLTNMSQLSNYFKNKKK